MSDIEVWRGPRVESVHQVAICVASDDGKIVFSHGNIEQKIFPRSAVKIIQAMPLLLSDAADAYALDDKMLSLACGSHSGEPAHVECARDMLARASLAESDLECGVHWPMRPAIAYALAALGQKASQLHNNCSGKHAGMLLTAKFKDYPTKDYVAADHPVQRAVTALLEKVMQEKLDEADIGIEGCSIPSPAFSLSALAKGFARLVSGKTLSQAETGAARRLFAACAAEPFYTAGGGRFDTTVMRLFGARVYVKTGAEGAYCGVLPELKIGFALKCRDGATRASECAAANIIDALLPMSDAEREKLAPLCAPALKNWRGIEVGKIKVSDEIKKGLSFVRPQ